MVRAMDVVITDCNHDPDDPNPVFIEMARLLDATGIRLSVENRWSDDYAKADLLIGADPIPDCDVILETRVLGQRTLNRLTRLQVALEVSGPVARFCSPSTDDDLALQTRDWGDLAVLKYDWSMRRNGVFLWPLGQARKPFPPDFDPTRDLFMEFLPDDPMTYKIEAFAGQILAAWVLPTRDMREPNWPVMSDANISPFTPPDRLIESISIVSRHLLRHGAGYTSFDLMRAGDAFRIVEINTCGVGTSNWKLWPEQYAANYARGILNATRELDIIPRYRALRAAAFRENSDLAAVVLPPKSGRVSFSDQEPIDEIDEHSSGERMLFDELLRSEQMPRRRLTSLWQDNAARLLAHARSTCPYYAERLNCLFAADGSIDWKRWNEVSFIDDKDVAENRSMMLSRKLPSPFGAVTHWTIAYIGRSPFTITRSHAQFTVDSILLTRLYHWHGIAPTANMATLLSAEETARRSPSWAPHWWSEAGGIEHHGDDALPAAEQLRWLAGLGEIYLKTTPRRLRLLGEAAGQWPGVLPTLKGVLISDVVTDDLRALCRGRFRCDIIDCYRRLEAGFLLLRCPDSDTYHTQTESCLIEIVDGNGNPCKPGEQGEIVVTPFYSYAMPLIRYRTGDFAEAARDSGFTQFCSCGRTLPGISRFACADAGTADQSRAP